MQYNSQAPNVSLMSVDLAQEDFRWAVSDGAKTVLTRLSNQKHLGKAEVDEFRYHVLPIYAKHDVL